MQQRRFKQILGRSRPKRRTDAISPQNGQLSIPWESLAWDDQRGDLGHGMFFFQMLLL